MKKRQRHGCKSIGLKKASLLVGTIPRLEAYKVWKIIKKLLCINCQLTLLIVPILPRQKIRGSLRVWINGFYREGREHVFDIFILVFGKEGVSVIENVWLTCSLRHLGSLGSTFVGLTLFFNFFDEFLFANRFLSKLVVSLHTGLILRSLNWSIIITVRIFFWVSVELCLSIPDPPEVLAAQLLIVRVLKALVVS